MYIQTLIKKILSGKPPVTVDKTPIKVVPQKNYGSSTSVVILVPVIHHIEPSTDESLRKLESLGYTVWRRYGFSSIEQCKCVMAQEALDAGFEHLFWINPDVNFSSADIEKLVNSEMLFVTVPYSTKGWPLLTTQFKDKEVVLGSKGGVYEINYTSSGFIYTHKSLYEKIRDMLDIKKVKIVGEDYELYPYFYPLIINDQYLDGDLSFCYRVKQTGTKIYSDTTIKIEHIGKYSYSLDYQDDSVFEKINGVVIKRIKK
jgi:hypothetical protein